MTLKIKLLIGVLVFFVFSFLIYANIQASEANKQRSFAMIAHKEVERQRKAAEAAEAHAKKMTMKAERMAAEMVKIYRTFEKCKNGEAYDDIALDPSISKNIVPFTE